ncbi:hypothetical protein BJ741DRAFT_595545 [Chytriomyces cf. hyalinus JEL632]|nr:hypothetical protein BJ741DRAFT_595545 [Chytriomyces cf. hyalinus JEL632]
MHLTSTPHILLVLAFSAFFTSAAPISKRQIIEIDSGNSDVSVNEILDIVDQVLGGESGGNVITSDGTVLRQGGSVRVVDGGSINSGRINSGGSGTVLQGGRVIQGNGRVIQGSGTVIQGSGGIIQGSGRTTGSGASINSGTRGTSGTIQNGGLNTNTNNRVSTGTTIQNGGLNTNTNTRVNTGTTIQNGGINTGSRTNSGTVQNSGTIRTTGGGITGLGTTGTGNTGVRVPPVPVNGKIPGNGAQVTPTPRRTPTVVIPKVGNGAGARPTPARQAGGITNGAAPSGAGKLAEKTRETIAAAGSATAVIGKDLGVNDPPAIYTLGGLPSGPAVNTVKEDGQAQLSTPPSEKVNQAPVGQRK